jgi:ubiquinone biosynthesis protein
MHVPDIFRIEQNARRLTEVLSVLGRYGLADWLGARKVGWLRRRLRSSGGEVIGEVSREARIRLVLTELGSTYIKFGQMLSTRGDLVGPALARELAQLRSNTPPDPPAVVRATIEAELGKPLDAVFSQFEEKALASASIGQVHQAVLLSGQAVVVKVQRAGIAEKVAGDLDIMAGLADLVHNHVPALRGYQPVAAVREFRRTLLNELDFSCERRNLEEFERNFIGDPTVHFPKVYPELCTRRVLTMERLVGISAEDIEGMRRAGVDLEAFARRGADLYLQMIFRDGFYHADPHAGNLMVLAGGVLGVLDCGMVGRVNDYLRQDLENFILGVIRTDVEEVTDAVTRMGSVPADLDHEALRSDLASFIGEYGSRPLRDLEVGRALTEATDIIRRYRITLPPACSLLLKTLVMLEGTGRQFTAHFSLAELLRPYGAQLLRRRFSPKNVLRRFQRTFRDWDRLVETFPRDLAEILQRLRNGTLEVRHEQRRFEPAINSLALAILSGALFVASALMLGQKAPPTLLGVSIPAVVGTIVATALAIRFLWMLGRSEG